MVLYSRNRSESSSILDLRVTVAPVQRFLDGDFVRRGFGFRHLFLGNNSHSCVGYLGRLPPQLPGTQVRVISEKLVAKNETASDAFLNLNRPFSTVSKPPPTPVTRRKN